MTAITAAKSGSESNKTKKEKNAAPTRVVIRRLPPSMTREDFEVQVSPIPEHDNLRWIKNLSLHDNHIVQIDYRYAKADFSLGQDAFCAAYINFLNQEDVYLFQERFDGYVFVDDKGNEYVAIVEFAPNQKLSPVKENKKKDLKTNTLDQDPDYLKFLEMLENKQEGLDNTVEQTLREIESKEKDNILNQTTPLLQFMKEKGEEKRKKREEQREQVRFFS